MPRISALLLVGATCALALAPAAGAAAPSEANATAVLEALVSDMAEHQGNIAAPTPQRLSNDEVIILEGSSRRQLGRCTCNEYRNGANAGSPVCNKLEGGRRVCYPMHNGACSDRESTACGSSGGGGSPMASPAPFADAEQEQEFYLNLNLQVYNAATYTQSLLPSPEQFAQTLATLASTPRSRVTVMTTWGAPQGAAPAASVRSVTQPTYAPNTLGVNATATVHATFAVRSSHRREALEAQLQMAEELPEINGRSFRILHMQVFEQSSHPLVCSAAAEGIKAETAALLRQLIELKRQELQLVSQGVTRAAGTVAGDALLNRIAAQLGVSIS